MSDYNQKYNKDDVYIRSMIVCLIAELNKKLYYYNRIDDQFERVSVPCLYAITGGERFLKDEFYYDALEMGKAIGDYERVPRCMINLSGISVNTSEQTNKYNHTKIVKPVNKKMRCIYLNVEYIPITLNFECKVICSNNIELFKITESIISKIYRNPNYFKVDYGMFNVDAAFSIPADYNHDSPQEFGLNDKKEYSTSFSIEMKSFIPAFENGLLISEIEHALQSIPTNWGDEYLENESNGENNGSNGENNGSNGENNGSANKNNIGLIEISTNEYGEIIIKMGGIFEKIILDTYHNHIDESDSVKSNMTTLPLTYPDITEENMVNQLIDKRIIDHK